MEQKVKDVLLFNSKRMVEGEVVLIPTFYGPSGCGKTWRAKQIYAELKEEVPDLRWARLLPGTMLPEEALGLPKVTETTTIWTAPEWATSGDPVFLFVDELDKARPETLGALLTLFAEGRIRDYPLPRGSMILAAMQPVNRGEWLSDETGQAIGARLMLIPLNHDWRYVEQQCGLADGALDFMPKPRDLTLPLTEAPSPRQVEYSIALLRKFGEDSKFFLNGIMQGQYINPLKEALGSSKTIAPSSLLEAVKDKRALLKQLSVPELMAILPESWFTTTDIMTDIYEQILLRGNAEDIAAAQKSIYEYLREKCEEGGGQCEIFPSQSDPEDLVNALNDMARRVGHEWMKRGEKK